MTRLLCSFLLFVAGSALGQTVTGSGTTNTIPKWTASTTLGNSSITDNGSTVTIGNPEIAAKVNNICFVDGVKYSTIKAAQIGCPTGTILVTSASPAQTLTTELDLSNQTLVIDSGASITIGPGGILDFATNAVLDASGATIYVTATSNWALQFNSGWAQVRLGRLIGPGDRLCDTPATGTGIGIRFINAEFNYAVVNEICNFGGAGVEFTSQTSDGLVHQGTTDNNVWVQHNHANGTGVLWKNPDTIATSTGYYDENNHYFGGLVNANATADVQFGDDVATYFSQFNEFVGYVDSRNSAHAPLIFKNSRYNFFQGAIDYTIPPPGITFLNSSSNEIHLPTGTTADCVSALQQWYCNGVLGFQAFNMTYENSSYLFRDKSNSVDYWWMQFMPNSGINVFGGANEPPNPIFHVNGALVASSKSFKIDHPLDPASKYLYHTSVESPDMTNFYNGNAVLDANGEAEINLPDWFQALNQDFRYQLTCIGGFAPVYVAREIENNSFRIAGGTSGLKVSWQVTGIRHDAFAEAHRSPVEEEKPAAERGHYLHPELFGASKDKSIGAH